MFPSTKFLRLGLTWWRLMEILGSALILILIAYAVVVALLYAEDGMTWDTSFQVDHVSSGGPAEQAGVELGDRILAIEGYPVDGWNPPVTQWRPDDTLNVTLERNGQRLILPIKLGALSLLELWLAMTPLIIAFSFWAVSSLTLGLARQSTEVRLFRGFSLVMSASLAAGHLSGCGVIWAAYLFRILAGPAVPLVLHFHFVLSGAQLGRRQRLILRAAYVIGIALMLPYVWTALATRRWSAGWEWRGLRMATRITPTAVALISLIWLIYSYTTTRSPDVRRRLRLVVLGVGWGFIPLLLLCLLPEAVLGFVFAPYPLAMSFLVLIPITYWYAAMRFDLLRADLVLNRSLVYLSVALILGCGYILTLHLADRFLPDLTFRRELTGVLLLVVASVAVVPLRGLMQRAVDRAFYGGWYDYRSVVSNVSRSLTGTLDRHTLEELLLERAAGTLWVRGAALLLPEPHSTGRLVGQQHGTFSIDPPLLNLETGGSLARYLCTVRRPVETSRLQQAVNQTDLTLSEAMLLNSKAIRWWVPMISDDGLIGLLLLGARLGEERFDQDDLQILSTLGDQAALAIKNILLLEELRLQLQETEKSHRTLEQMHRQLLIGREEERKRLSRDLHDGPVQQLIAFRYQLGECTAKIGDPELSHTLNELRDEARVLLDELRALCTKLRPPLLDSFGLAPAIRAHNEATCRQGLRIRLLLDEDEDWQLPEEVAVSLFRVYQEALSNAIRHANATQIVSRLYMEGARATLEIQDDGAGFVVPDSMDSFATDGHFGLLGIRERVELLNGEFELESQPGGITTLRVSVPVQVEKR